ncbi:GntR family transcriptional regulator [Rhodoferax koreense]|uniref:GntR family transcriptional regulator n=1 Tax=Rhodoferax koreensis TaxID=1842727 RepID=A0A1P8K156_9BURK|nr:GntR family transcriptional regulator [Rhodoferax koreense]APW39671.1 GntR family transcriptional regulator [Rhodoferax koreense]
MNTQLEPVASKANSVNIARHLTEAITSAHFEVGTLLPTELELCKHYGTSRHTIRAALAELQALGLVSRRKNVGTRVVSAKPKLSFRPSLASVDDLVHFGTEHVRVVQSIERVEAGGALAGELGCAEGAVWLRFSSLRMETEKGSLPIGWTDVYVDPAYHEIADVVRASPDTLISALIEERFGRRIEEIQQDVRASALDDADIAKALGLEVGASVLKIVRRYLDADSVAFEVSVSVHPAERFSISMRLRR